jgi:uncharacterized membrane protein
MDKAKITGAILATAVGVMFLSQTARAADQDTAQVQVKCVGGNSCKGQSACKSAQNSCKGQNACKGKGFVMAASDEQCAQKGGHTEKQ